MELQQKAQLTQNSAYQQQTLPLFGGVGDESDDYLKVGSGSSRSIGARELLAYKKHFG